MPLSQIRQQLAILAMALFFMLGGSLGFIVANWTNGLSEADLIPGGVNSCVTAVKSSLVLLDPDSIVAFDQETIAELRVLPDRCDDPAIKAAMEAQYPHLLDRLQSIGARP